MKIAIIIKHYSLYQGGAERHAVHLSQALAAAGHEIHILANRFDSSGEYPVQWHPVAMRKQPSWLKIMSFARNARKALERERFDIRYGLTQVYPLDLYRMGDGIFRHWSRTRFPSTPIRYIGYIMRPVHLVNLYLEKQIYRRGNYHTIVSNSELCKRQLHEYYGVPEHRVEVIYNGVDHALFNPGKIAPFREKVREKLGLSPSTPLILFAANNWGRKGLSTLLHALAVFGKNPLPHHLLVAGRGNSDHFLRLSGRLGLERRVHFQGPTRCIEKYYSAADLLVLPTLYDPFANVCLEAMACGLPVITSVANGAAELIREGSNGRILKNPVDSEELANLLECCSDRKTLESMGQAARDTALQFTFEKTAAGTMEVCRRIVEAAAHTEHLSL